MTDHIDLLDVMRYGGLRWDDDIHEEHAENLWEAGVIDNHIQMGADDQSQIEENMQTLRAVI